MKKFIALVVLLCVVTIIPDICYASRGYHSNNPAGAFFGGIVWMGIAMWLWSGVVHVVKRFMKNKSSDDLKCIIIFATSALFLSWAAFGLLTYK